MGNTGPAHLAAAVGTPIVSLFAPTVPAARGRRGVSAVVLGDQAAACRGTRATTCPVPGHPCLSTVTAADVLAALDRLGAGSLRVLLWHVHGSWTTSFVQGPTPTSSR